MNNDLSKNESLGAPTALVKALREVSSERIFVPPAIDHEIIRAAELQLKGPEHPRKRWNWWTGLVTATALVVVLTLLLGLWQSSTRGHFAREDVNRDGAVDILDAFALARRVKQDSRLDPKLDLNGDGVVDEKDVATVAARVVKLDKGGRS